ncbi:hypothetical protein ACRZ5S_08395 [Vibrio scophthalmi]|uniref:hypothetical protein n=1 Tax=Vibrio scophthalmi TaxID=45658 RepID=UPI003EBBD784
MQLDIPVQPRCHTTHGHRKYDYLQQRQDQRNWLIDKPKEVPLFQWEDINTNQHHSLII